jgi:hypothetical protein
MLSLLSYSFLMTAVSFWLTYLIALLSLNSTIWSIHLLPESLSISFLIIFLFFYRKYELDDKRSALAIAGLFLGLTVLMRPHLAPLFLVLVVDISLIQRRKQLTGFIRRSARAAVLVAAPMVVMLSPWVVRNYLEFRQFIPLQVNALAGYNYSEADLACRRFIQAWGGSFIYWDKRSAGCYFQPQPGLECEFQLPAYALADGYGTQDIEDVRKDYISVQRNYDESLMKDVAARFDGLADIYRSKHPFRYHIVSPLLICKTFLFHSGSYYLPIKRGPGGYRPVEALMKLSQTLLYYLTLVVGGVGLVLISFRPRIQLMYLAIPALLIGLACFVYRAPEFRYFSHSYPLLVVGTAFAIVSLRNVWKNSSRAGGGS